MYYYPVVGLNQLDLFASNTLFNPIFHGRNQNKAAPKLMSDHAPSVGLILCKSRDRVRAEYALRDINKPIGVAEWQTKLVQSLSEALKGSLPSIEQIEAEFGPEETT